MQGRGLGESEFWGSGEKRVTLRKKIENATETVTLHVLRHVVCSAYDAQVCIEMACQEIYGGGGEARGQGVDNAEGGVL